MKRVTSVCVVIALILGLSGASAFAKAASDSDGPPKTSESASKPQPTASGSKPNAKLKSDMLKLVGDAKAGKVAPRPQQLPRTAKNNLSTGAKIGIAAAIGGAIFLIIILRALNSDDD